MGKPITSCSNCRRSRLGCNANLQLGQACYNCARKGVQCELTTSTTGEKRHGKTHMPKKDRRLQNGRQQSSAEPPVTFNNMIDEDDMVLEPSTEPESPLSSMALASFSSPSDLLAKSQQAWRLQHLLWNVFTTLLEPRIGLWIGGAGCPFLSASTVGSDLEAFVGSFLTT